MPRLANKRPASAVLRHLPALCVLAAVLAYAFAPLLRGAPPSERAADGDTWTLRTRTDAVKLVALPSAGLLIEPGDTLRLKAPESTERTLHRIAFDVRRQGTQSGYLSLTFRERAGAKYRLLVVPGPTTRLDLSSIDPAGASALLASVERALAPRALFQVAVVLDGPRIGVELDRERLVTVEDARDDGGRVSLSADGVRVLRLSMAGTQRAADGSRTDFESTEMFAAFAQAPQSAWDARRLLAALLVPLLAVGFLRALCLGRPRPGALVRATAAWLTPPALLLLATHGRPLPEQLAAGAFLVAALLGVLPVAFLLRPQLLPEHGASPPSFTGRLRAGVVIVALAGGLAWSAYAATARGVRDVLQRAAVAVAEPMAPAATSAGAARLDLASGLELAGPWRSLDLRARVELQPDALLEVRLHSGGQIAEGVALVLSTDAGLVTSFYRASGVEFRPVGTGSGAVPAGKAFDLAVGVRGSSFEAAIDGERIASAEELRFPSGAIHIVAPRGVARVSELSVVPAEEPAVPGAARYGAPAAGRALLLLLLLGVLARLLLSRTLVRSFETASYVGVPLAAALLAADAAGTVPTTRAGLAGAAALSLLVLQGLVHGRGRGVRAVAFVVLGGLALGWTVSDAAAGPGVQARTRDPVHEDFAGPRTLAGLAHFQHPVLRRSDTWLKDHRFRDRRFTLEKPAGTARVVCIGSSSTWGHAILPETGGDYPAALERALRARNPDLQVEVLNGAIRGGTTARLNVFLREVLLEFDPDVVTASWFFNDAVSGSQYDEGEFFARIAADDYHHGPWQRRQVQRATRAGADALSRLFSRFGAEGTDCVAAWREILGDPDAETPLDRFTANLRSTAELCRERGVRLILIKEPLRGDVPWIWKQEFYRAIDAVGAEFGVPVVDPGPPLRSIGTASLFMDVVHPLPAGNEVIAETLAPFVEDALSAR